MQIYTPQTINAMLTYTLSTLLSHTYYTFQQSSNAILLSCIKDDHQAIRKEQDFNALPRPDRPNGGFLILSLPLFCLSDQSKRHALPSPFVSSSSLSFTLSSHDGAVLMSMEIALRSNSNKWHFRSACKFAPCLCPLGNRVDRI